jgi:hypothetical protein
MKKICFILIAALIVGNYLSAQEGEVKDFKPSGKATGKVFWNYNFNLSEGVKSRNSFELKRTYLGYKYKFSETISAKIVLDGSKESDASDFTVFAKNAQLDWKVTDNIKLTGGLMGTKQFDTQEKFRGYRYIIKSLQDEVGFGASADLGINGEFVLNDIFKVNLFAFNGEGYTKMQDKSGSIKLGGNVIVNPADGFTLKAYYDIYGNDYTIKASDASDSVIYDTASISTIAFFAGYKSEKFRIGAEYNIQLNGVKYTQVAQDFNMTGLALYGTYIFNPKFEVFAQWMNVQLDGPAQNPNNISSSKTGDIILAGIQHSPVKGVNMALTYKSFIPNIVGGNSKSLLYLNFEFYF